MSKIQTERLLLRPITLDDANDIFEYSKDIDVGSNAGWQPHKDIDETIKIMKDIFIDKENVWGIILKTNNKLIGSIGLVDDSKRENECAKMIGYSIGKNYWSNGYMTESVKSVVDFGFKELNLRLISAYCYPFNQRSKRVLEKCNFKYEGTLKLAEKIYDGRILDNECYSILAKDY